MRTRCGARRPRTSRPAGWRCGGSCSDPHQPAPAPGGKACRAQEARTSPACSWRRSCAGLVAVGRVVHGAEPDEVGPGGAQRLPQRSEIKKLDAEIKDIANLRAEIDALKARQKAVEDLQADRNVPVHLLNELVKQTPEGVLSHQHQAGRPDGHRDRRGPDQRARLRVSAQHALQLVLAGAARADRDQGNVPATAQQGRTTTASRVFDFSMRVSIKRPQSPRRRRQRARPARRRPRSPRHPEVDRTMATPSKTPGLRTQHDVRAGGRAVPRPRHASARPVADPAQARDLVRA